MGKKPKRTARDEAPKPSATVTDTGKAKAISEETAVTGYRRCAPGNTGTPRSVRVSDTGDANGSEGAFVNTGYIHHMNVEALTVQQYGQPTPDRQTDSLPTALLSITPGGAPPAEIVSAAESLACEMRRRWQREERHRRVHDPFPLPLRYRSTTADLMDRPENIQRLQPGATAQDLDLSGDLRSVVETYRSVASQRLVVLGRAGSGKSILAIKFVLDLLTAPEAPALVPVIFSIGSWDPATTSLRDILVDRLLRDHPHLARRSATGATLAAELIDAELVLPVLDGFDELAEALRGPALKALNATSIPLVLTSRQDEYAQAVSKAHAPLVWAACIELTDLTIKDLAAYLPRTDRLASGGRDEARLWDTALERLRIEDTPASARLAQVLGTPLMVTLARTMYSDTPGRNPMELFDTARFPTEHHLEEHLLAGFVPTVYQHRAPERIDTTRSRRKHDPDQAQRWLGYLASLLTHDEHDRQDLAWWRLGKSLRGTTRVLHTVLVSALCMFAATCLVEPFGYALVYRPLEFDHAFVYSSGFDLASVLLQGMLAGLSCGVAFGLVHCALALSGRSAALPSQVRLRISGADRRVGRRSREVLARSGAGLLGGSSLGIGYAWLRFLLKVLDGAFPRTELIRTVIGDTLLFGLTFGLTGGLLFGLLAVFEAPMDHTAAATPAQLLSANRATAIRQLLVLVPTITLGCALIGYVVARLLQQVSHWTILWPLDWALILGATGGLGGSTSYVFAFTAWGQWLTTARIWLPLTRKLPWDPAVFLEDAYHRDVLRHTGAVYQFRHIRLQQHLAHSYRGPSHGRTTAAEPTEAVHP
ncbi:NACHT domain-containing protein [Streptomyces sp. NPDC057418]|uniref:NACHT domain-containing protein n=1 Tax=unclassified Streptomyces TaxID=2593676 RepID=UPI003678B56D